MTVPATGWKVFAIKKELRNAGWKLKIADTTLEEEQTSSKKKVTEVKYQTAYRLYFENSGGAATSVTIIENKTNEMVLELSARLYHHSMWADFGKTIVKELEKKE